MEILCDIEAFLVIKNLIKSNLTAKNLLASELVNNAIMKIDSSYKSQDIFKHSKITHDLIRNVINGCIGDMKNQHQSYFDYLSCKLIENIFYRKQFNLSFIDCMEEELGEAYTRITKSFLSESKLELYSEYDEKLKDIYRPKSDEFMRLKRAKILISVVFLILFVMLMPNLIQEKNVNDTTNISLVSFMTLLFFCALKLMTTCEANYANQKHTSPEKPHIDFERIITREYTKHFDKKEKGNLLHYIPENLPALTIPSTENNQNVIEIIPSKSKRNLQRNIGRTLGYPKVFFPKIVADPPSRIIWSASEVILRDDKDFVRIEEVTPIRADGSPKNVIDYAYYNRRALNKQDIPEMDKKWHRKRITETPTYVSKKYESGIKRFLDIVLQNFKIGELPFKDILFTCESKHYSHVDRILGRKVASTTDENGIEHNLIEFSLYLPKGLNH